MNNEIKQHVLSIVEDLENGIELDSERVEELGYDGIMSGFDYLTDVLDIEWILNSDKTLKGARILVAFGGPNIWIDTVKQTVIGTWWGDSFTTNYDNDAMDIAGALEEFYHC